MLKPHFLDQCKFDESRFIAYIFQKAPENIMRIRSLNEFRVICDEEKPTYGIHVKIAIIAKDIKSGINYNPITMMNYFNSFDEFTVYNWDDDREFDFESPNMIQLVVKLSDDATNEFIETMINLYPNFLDFVNNMHYSESMKIEFNSLFANYFINRYSKMLSIE
jgi:hypothetical protein